MNTVNRDRAVLKRLVESYGKADVLKYIKHLNEAAINKVLLCIDISGSAIYNYENSNYALQDIYQDIAYTEGDIVFFSEEPIPYSSFVGSDIADVPVHELCKNSRTMDYWGGTNYETLIEYINENITQYDEVVIVSDGDLIYTKANKMFATIADEVQVIICDAENGTCESI